MNKTGRNDPCPCGSGKKFKKCCERKMIKGKFLASKVQPNSGGNLASFFQHNVAKETPFTLKNRSISVKEGAQKTEEKPPEQAPEAPLESPEENKEENS